MYSIPQLWQYYDLVEKQFRGFARVEQVDLGDVSVPTLVTRSYFDTGKSNEVMKGKVLRLAIPNAPLWMPAAR